MYALVDVLHGLAMVAARHAASTAFYCASDATVFFSFYTTLRRLRSAIDNLRRMQSCCLISPVQSSSFVLATGAFPSFAKGAFGPFVTASLPGGLGDRFLGHFFGAYRCHGWERVATVGGRNKFGGGRERVAVA
jgi:hypothetical protein